MNFFKFLRALIPGTVLYDHTTDQLLISCGCMSYPYRLYNGLVLRTEEHGLLPRPIKTQLSHVKNLSNYTIIGRMK